MKTLPSPSCAYGAPCVCIGGLQGCSTSARMVIDSLPGCQRPTQSPYLQVYAGLEAWRPGPKQVRPCARARAQDAPGRKDCARSSSAGGAGASGGRARAGGYCSSVWNDAASLTCAPPRRAARVTSGAHWRPAAGTRAVRCRAHKLRPGCLCFAPVDLLDPLAKQSYAANPYICTAYYAAPQARSYCNAWCPWRWTSQRDAGSAGGGRGRDALTAGRGRARLLRLVPVRAR
jgi:hypothetical protein